MGFSIPYDAHEIRKAQSSEFFFLHFLGLGSSRSLKVVSLINEIRSFINADNIGLRPGILHGEFFLAEQAH